MVLLGASVRGRRRAAVPARLPADRGARRRASATSPHLIWRPLTATLLWNTVRLTVVVTVLCAVIGTLAAWCVERTDLPGRRIWAVLVVVPFAIPDFVVSFGWASLTTWVQGFRGAVLVMTLAVYPLVYLPVAASLRSADPGQEEVARSLGLGRVRTFLRVTLGQARGAILGGCVLVAWCILAEYGAFEILGYQTFTTEIFTEFQVSFNVPTACALSLVLVVLSIVVLGGDAAARGRGRVARTGPLAQRVDPAAPARPGHASRSSPASSPWSAWPSACRSAPASTGCSRAAPMRSPASRSLDAGWHTALYSGAAAALATLLALPVALLAVRHGSRAGRLLERSTFLVLAMPGLVIAFALSYFAERYADGFGYQTRPAADRRLRHPVLPARPRRGPGLGGPCPGRPGGGRRARSDSGAWPCFRRVTLPLVGPGLAAAFCLVFLAAVTELTATLILIPTGVQTLATQFWAYQQNLSYGQAAPFALVMIAIAASELRARPLLRPAARRATRLAMNASGRRPRQLSGLHKAFGSSPCSTGLDLTVAAGA